MKKTIIAIIILSLVLIGCGDDPVVCEVCDYSSINTLTARNTELSTENLKFQKDYLELKSDCNDLKLSILQNISTPKIKDTSQVCLTFIRQIARLEDRLEECYYNETYRQCEWDNDNYTQLQDCLFDLNETETRLEEIEDLLD